MIGFSQTCENDLRFKKWCLHHFENKHIKFTLFLNTSDTVQYSSETHTLGSSSLLRLRLASSFEAQVPELEPGVGVPQLPVELLQRDGPGRRRAAREAVLVLTN